MVSASFSPGGKASLRVGAPPHLVKGIRETGLKIFRTKFHRSGYFQVTLRSTQDYKCWTCAEFIHEDINLHQAGLYPSGTQTGTMFNLTAASLRGNIEALSPSCLFCILHIYVRKT